MSEKIVLTVDEINEGQVQTGKKVGSPYWTLVSAGEKYTKFDEEAPEGLGAGDSVELWYEVNARGYKNIESWQKLDNKATTQRFITNMKTDTVESLLKQILEELRKK